MAVATISAAVDRTGRKVEARKKAQTTKCQIYAAKETVVVRDANDAECNKSSSPVKPAGPLNAYNFFFKYQRMVLLHSYKLDATGKGSAKATQPPSAEEYYRTASPYQKDKMDKKNRMHRKTHGKIGFTELAKLISGKWKNLPATEKEFYKNLAQEDLMRWRREREEYEKLLKINEAESDQVKKGCTTLESACSESEASDPCMSKSCNSDNRWLQYEAHEDMQSKCSLDIPMNSPTVSKHNRQSYSHDSPLPMEHTSERSDIQSMPWFRCQHASFLTNGAVRGMQSNHQDATAVTPFSSYDLGSQGTPRTRSVSGHTYCFTQQFMRTSAFPTQTTDNPKPIYFRDQTVITPDATFSHMLSSPQEQLYSPAGRSCSHEIMRQCAKLEALDNSQMIAESNLHAKRTNSGVEFDEDDLDFLEGCRWED